MQRWAQKDRNGMDLTEAEDIKKRWQEYTEELYKTDLHAPDHHDGICICVYIYIYIYNISIIYTHVHVYITYKHICMYM